MKSNFFLKNRWLENQYFINDLILLINLKNIYFDELLALFQKVELLELKNDEEDLFQQTGENLSLDQATLRKAYNLTQAFVRAFAVDGDAYNDPVETIIDDIKSTLPLELESKEKLLYFLSQAKNLATAGMLAAFYNQRKYENSGFPIMMAIAASVDMRAMFKTEIASNQTISDYEPICEGFIPIGIVKLVLGSINPTKDFKLEHVNFQLTQREIKTMISKLQSLDKQLEAASNYIT